VPRPTFTAAAHGRLRLRSSAFGGIPITEFIFLSEGDADATSTLLEGDASAAGSIEGGALVGVGGLEGG
jgi:hypothetical protein